MKWRFCSSCQELLFLIFFYLHFSGAILLFVLSGTDAGDVITLSKAAKVQVHVQVQVHLFPLIQLQYNDKGKKGRSKKQS